MVAVYAAGGRYKRHRDNSVLERKSPQNPRALTVIFYATPDDWRDDRDSGHLRFYSRDDGFVEDCGLAGEEREPYVDVAPRPGRLVIFDSFFGHEVLKPSRDRSAITFWIYADYADLDRR